MVKMEQVACLGFVALIRISRDLEVVKPTKLPMSAELKSFTMLQLTGPFKPTRLGSEMQVSSPPNSGGR